MLVPRHLVRFDEWVDIDALIGHERKPNAIFGHGVQLALADPLKVFCHQTLGLLTTDLWNPAGMSPSTRLAVQSLGTEWGRAHDPNVWIRLALDRASAFLSTPRVTRPMATEHFASSWRIDSCDVVVISDVRFRNEAEAIYAAGGVVWRLLGPSSNTAAATSTTPTSEHVSETDLDNVDASFFSTVIANTGSLADLRHAVEATLRTS